MSSGASGEDRPVRPSRRGMPIPRRAGALLAALAVVTLLFFAFVDLTPRETLLLGIFQTIFSLGAGWAITHAYAEDSLSSAIAEVEEVYQKNLKTYALKAAEKVENLSMQLVGLAAYLNDELEENSYRSADDELAAKEERMYSAVHLISVLKSVNDTSLSDWRGVIGAELDRRQEAAEEREEEFERILEQLNSLNVVEVSPDSATSQQGIDIVEEVRAVRDEVRRMARTIGIPVAATRKQSRWPAKRFALPCPSCESLLFLTQKAKPGLRKGVVCKDCDASLMLSIDANGNGALAGRRELPERVDCPECSAELELLLDELIGATHVLKCGDCEAYIRISRAMTGLRISVGPPDLTDKMVENVRHALPLQPWPKGIHREVATSLDLPPNIVQRAIKRLISSGAFMDQYEGVLCTTEQKVELMRKARAVAR